MEDSFSNIQKLYNTLPTISLNISLIFIRIIFGDVFFFNQHQKMGLNLCKLTKIEKITSLNI